MPVLKKKYNYQKLYVANQDLKIKNSQSKIIILISIIFLSTLLIFFLIWKNIVKQREISVEKQLLEKEREKNEKELENKLLLEKQLKFQSIMMLNLEQYRKNSLKKPENLKTGMSPVLNTTFYDEMIACMDLEYNNISKRLKNKFPALSEQDLLICCLLLANFDTGMIASILDVKIESMNKSRYRLRSKLGLNKSDNLCYFISNF